MRECHQIKEPHTVIESPYANDDLEIYTSDIRRSRREALQLLLTGATVALLGFAAGRGFKGNDDQEFSKEVLLADAAVRALHEKHERNRILQGIETDERFLHLRFQHVFKRSPEVQLHHASLSNDMRNMRFVMDRPPMQIHVPQR